MSRLGIKAMMRGRVQVFLDQLFMQHMFLHRDSSILVLKNNRRHTSYRGVDGGGMMGTKGRVKRRKGEKEKRMKGKKRVKGEMRGNEAVKKFDSFFQPIKIEMRSHPPPHSPNSKFQPLSSVFVILIII